MSDGKTRVLDWSYLPARLPATDTVIWWLFLDRLQSPGWVYGVVGTFLFAMWLGSLMKLSRQERWRPQLEERMPK